MSGEDPVPYVEPRNVRVRFDVTGATIDDLQKATLEAMWALYPGFRTCLYDLDVRPFVRDDQGAVRTWIADVDGAIAPGR